MSFLRFSFDDDKAVSCSLSCLIVLVIFSFSTTREAFSFFKLSRTNFESFAFWEDDVVAAFSFFSRSSTCCLSVDCSARRAAAASASFFKSLVDSSDAANFFFNSSASFFDALSRSSYSTNLASRSFWEDSRSCIFIFSSFKAFSVDSSFARESLDWTARNFLVSSSSFFKADDVASASLSLDWITDTSLVDSATLAISASLAARVFFNASISELILLDLSVNSTFSFFSFSRSVLVIVTCFSFSAVTFWASDSFLVAASSFAERSATLAFNSSASFEDPAAACFSVLSVSIFWLAVASSGLRVVTCFLVDSSSSEALCEAFKRDLSSKAFFSASCDSFLAAASSFSSDSTVSFIDDWSWAEASFFLTSSLKVTDSAVSFSLSFLRASISRETTFICSDKARYFLFASEIFIFVAFLSRFNSSLWIRAASSSECARVVNLVFSVASDSW